MAEEFEVIVFIAQGRRLIVCDVRSSDPFVKCSCRSEIATETKMTRVVGSCLNPIFNEQLHFSFRDRRPTFVQLDVFDHDTFNTNDEMGSLAFPLPAEGFKTDEAFVAIPPKWYPLTLKADKSRDVGQLQVQVVTRRIGAKPKMSYKEICGLLKVTIGELCGSTSLTDGSDGKMEMYVDVFHGMTGTRTKTIPSGKAKVWNEDARFWITTDNSSHEILLRVFGDDTSTQKQDGTLLGRAVIDVNGLLSLTSCISCDPSADLLKKASEGAFVQSQIERIEEVGFSDKDASRHRSERKELTATAGVSGPAIAVKLSFVRKDVLVRTAFDTLWGRFDADRNGTLDRVEVSAMLDVLSMASRRSEPNSLDGNDFDVDLFMRKVDSNNDGVIEQGEMKKIFESTEFQNSPLSAALLAFVLDGEEALHRIIHGRYNSVAVIRNAKGLATAAMNTGGSKEVDDMGLLLFDRRSGLLLKEHIPNYIKMALKAMYRTGFGKLVAETQAARSMLTAQSVKEGAAMDLPESKKKILPFIEEHQLDPTTFRRGVDEYEHFNAFFYRQMKEGLRPICEPQNCAIAVSPADCRMSVFKSVFDATVVWIKGSEFTVEKLLGPRAAALADQFAAASLIIARLAPQDYHRFHAPITGKIEKVTAIDGPLYTVNPIAIRQPVNVYTENKRVIIEIDTADFGRVIMIPVGATMVGSIVLLPHVQPGENVVKGHEMGYFAFGGSTVLLLFQNARIAIDADMLEKSAIPLEVLINQGDRIGVAAAAAAPRP